MSDLRGKIRKIGKVGQITLRKRSELSINLLAGIRNPGGKDSLPKLVSTQEEDCRQGGCQNRNPLKRASSRPLLTDDIQA